MYGKERLHALIAEAESGGLSGLSPRQASMLRKIRRIVRIQKVKNPRAHLNAPGPNPDSSARKSDGELQPFALRGPHRRKRQLTGILLTADLMEKSAD
jgi:hypothetical protein